MAEHLICIKESKGKKVPSGSILLSCERCEGNVVASIDEASSDDEPLIFCLDCVAELKMIGEGTIIDLYLQEQIYLLKKK